LLVIEDIFEPALAARRRRLAPTRTRTLALRCCSVARTSAKSVRHTETQAAHSATRLTCPPRCATSARVFGHDADIT